MPAESVIKALYFKDLIKWVPKQDANYEDLVTCGIPSDPLLQFLLAIVHNAIECLNAACVWAVRVLDGRLHGFGVSMRNYIHRLVKHTL